MSAVLRLRMVALLALLGASATAAGYLSGGPAWVGVLMTATTLVAAVTLTLGRVAAFVTTTVAATAVVAAQLAGDGRARVSFGTPGLQLPSLSQGTFIVAATVGLVTLLSSLVIAVLLGRSLTDLDATEATPPASLGATLVRLSLGPRSAGHRGRRVTGADLAEMVAPELRQLGGAAVVRSGRSVDVLVLLPGADDEQAEALVRRLDGMARERLERTLRSSTVILEGRAAVAEPTRQERPARSMQGLAAIGDASVDLM